MAVGGWYMEDREIEISAAAGDEDHRVDQRPALGVLRPDAARVGAGRRADGAADGNRRRRRARPAAGEAQLAPDHARVGLRRRRRRPSSASRSGSTSREEEWCEFRDWRATPDRRATMSRIRRGWALTKKSWGLLQRAPRTDPLPALRRGRDRAAGDRHDRARALPVREGRAGRGDPAAGDRRLRAQRRRLLLQRRPRGRRRHDLPRPGRTSPSPTASPSPAAASARSAAGRRSAPRSAW